VRGPGRRARASLRPAGAVAGLGWAPAEALDVASCRPHGFSWGVHMRRAGRVRGPEVHGILVGRTGSADLALFRLRFWTNLSHVHVGRESRQTEARRSTAPRRRRDSRAASTCDVLDVSEDRNCTRSSWRESGRRIWPHSAGVDCRICRMHSCGENRARGRRSRPARTRAGRRPSDPSASATNRPESQIGHPRSRSGSGAASVRRSVR
jgi:hypothetical protein